MNKPKTAAAWFEYFQNVTVPALHEDLSGQELVPEALEDLDMGTTWESPKTYLVFTYKDDAEKGLFFIEKPRNPLFNPDQTGMIVAGVFVAQSDNEVQSKFQQIVNDTQL